MNNGQDNDHTSNVEKLIIQANQMLEVNNFAAAHDLYRAAAMAAPPTQHVLANLHVAREQEELQFSQALTEKYPHTIVTWKNEIATLLQMGNQWNAHAVVRCSELLAKGNMDPVEEHRIRRLRLRAATRAIHYSTQHVYQTLANDFSRLWIDGDNHVWATRSRAGIIRDLASIDEPEAIPVLEELARLMWLPSDVKHFLEDKIEELRALEEVLSSYR